jgi:hypothetical protein
MTRASKASQFAALSLLVVGLMTIGIFGFARDKNETIDATAYGIGT